MSAMAARSLALVLAAAAFAYAVTSFDRTGLDLPGWWYLGAALLLSVVWQWRICAARPVIQPVAVTPGSRGRSILGSLLAIAGFGCFCWASLQLHRDWQASFDTTWLTWVGAAAVMAIGLDLAWGRWPRPSGLWSGADLAIVAALFGAGAALRIWGLVELPGPYHVTQLEEVQIGSMGHVYLVGSRVRWEFLSHMWLSALGQALFGSSDMVPVRIPFAAVSSLKLIPLYYFLRWTVGRAGAVTATALLACSGWDVMLSRIPTNQNELTAATTFAVLAGPARRGRPSAYVFLGLVAGYLSYEYIAYRPLALFILAAAAWLSFNDLGSSWPRRWFRPVLIVAMAAAMATPLFASKITKQFGFRYLDGWNRARGTSYYSDSADWQTTVDKRLHRARVAFGTLFFGGDRATVRNLHGRPLLDRVTAALFIAGVAFALTHWMSGLLPLTLLAFLVTFTGTLIATGELWLGRAGCNVFYLHALVGFGAAGIATLLGALLDRWPRRRPAVVYAVLAGCVAAAALSNLRFLTEYWRSPAVVRAQHYELAYQTQWVSGMARPGERVVGLSSRIANVLMGSDAAWMRPRPIDGEVYTDAVSLIDEIEEHRKQALFIYVAADRGGAEVVALLESIWPQLSFEAVEHPLHPRNEAIYFARVDRGRLPPPASSGLAANRCRSAAGRFGLRLKNGEERGVEALFPFFDRSTWPQEVRMMVRRLPIAEVTLDVPVRFAVEKPGRYTFRVAAAHGRASVAVAEGGKAGARVIEVELDSGVHEIQVSGVFAPRSAEPQLRLEWRGPDSGGRFAVMPIHRIGVPRADCGGATPPADPTT